MAGKKDKKRVNSKELITTWPLYVLLVVVFLLYIFYQKIGVLATAFGSATFILIFALLIIEVINGSQQEDRIKNLLEMVGAIVLVVIAWFSLKIILHTNYPLDAVPSCSMLPYLQRGDMIVLKGANSSTIKAPTVDVTAAAMQKMLKNINNESLECVAYDVNGAAVNISQVLLPGYSIGLFKPEGTGGVIVPYSQQQNNLVKYQCGTTSVVFNNGTTMQEAALTSITIGTTVIKGDNNNTIIVYKTLPQDLFYREGDSYVVHRVYAIINADGESYYLTKGDNNPGLDMQYSNIPSNQSNVEGKVIARIPYLGYFKLILSGAITQPQGCNYVLQD